MTVSDSFYYASLEIGRTRKMVRKLILYACSSLFIVLSAMPVVSADWKDLRNTEPFWRTHAIKVTVELFGSEFPSASKLLTKDHLKHIVESRLISEGIDTTESIKLPADQTVSLRIATRSPSDEGVEWEVQLEMEALATIVGTNRKELTRVWESHTSGKSGPDCAPDILAAIDRRLDLFMEDFHTMQKERPDWKWSPNY
jgi:hypothetical protein